jgi:FixJ family two-component response regulator
MARLKLVPKREQSKMAVHTITLTPDVVEAIHQLSRDATDFLGRTVSGSAIIRALVRHAIQGGPPVADALFIEVEKELQAGVLWGKKK